MHAYAYIGSLKEGDKILFWGGHPVAVFQHRFLGTYFSCFVLFCLTP